MVHLRTRLPPNAPVELILPLHEGRSTRYHRLPAIVTRCDETGAGLMFGRIEQDMWTAVVAHVTPKTAGETETHPGVPVTSGS